MYDENGLKKAHSSSFILEPEEDYEQHPRDTTANLIDYTNQNITAGDRLIAPESLSDKDFLQFKSLNDKELMFKKNPRVRYRNTGSHALSEQVKSIGSLDRKLSADGGSQKMELANYFAAAPPFNK